MDETLPSCALHRAVSRPGQPRDPDAAWARRDRQARFGHKLHLGVDAESELVRRAVLTLANVNETRIADELIAGDKASERGDAAYGAHARSARLQARGIQDHLIRRPSKHQPRLSPPPPRPDRSGATAGGACVGPM